MNTAVINRLKEGSIKNVILFGDSEKMVSPPYVVVKPEPGANSDKQNFRIIVHRIQGENDFSEKYIFEELPVLFARNIWLEDGSGKRFRIMNNGDWYGPIAQNDDGTIAYERIFYAPKLI